MCLLGGTTALADSQSGAHGRYLVTDTSSHPGATCNYTPDYPNHYLVSLSVRAPSLWWPNTSAADRVEHGTVGWLPAVQRQTGGAWITVASGTEQQAVAHEDRPRHDPADRARLSNQTVAWYASEPDTYRATLTATWYAADGSVMGQVKHTVRHYRVAYRGYSAKSTGGCPGRITILG